MKDVALAARTIEHFEGFAAVAYWDVNHYRVGYGSDTRTAHQISVKRGDRTTRAEAFENLEARLPKFEYVIIKQVGRAEWDRLSATAQAALLSVCYNYGHLPPHVVTAVRGEHPPAAIAQAVRALEHDNRGVNRARRAHEAQMIESGK